MHDDRHELRRPLNLSLVLDRSGSMAGRALEDAKRCAASIIDQLSARDRVTLVVYDECVDVLVPSTPVADKALFMRAISGIHAEEHSALFDGWYAGAAQCRVASAGDYLSRVLLLSDGCANQGLTDTADIAAYCALMASAGIGTSTYGLGTQYNRELMVAMAQAGAGQAYHGASAQDLMDAFQQEFALPSSP